MEFEQILSRFEGVAKSGDGYRAKCSAHNDKTPSLSIGEGDDGRILLKCHRGCETEAVLGAVGLTLRDLYPENASSQKNTNHSSISNSDSSRFKPAAVLPEAQIENGRGYYGHLQDNFNSLTADLPWTKEAVTQAGAGYDPNKSRFVFIIRNPNGDLINLKHHKGPEGQPPFSLDEHGQNCFYSAPLQKEYDDDYLILTEGETDCITAISQGFQALTGTAGAKSVVKDLTSLSKFKRIFIIFDNDEAGKIGAIMWAEAICQQCPGVTVYVSTWPENKPEGYDLTAYFKEEHSGREFQLLMMTNIEPYQLETPTRTGTSNGRKPVLIRMADVRLEVMNWLWEPYIPLGKITIIEGDPGATKTWFALGLSGIVSRGGAFPGPDGVLHANNETPGRVIYCTAEDGLGDTLRPRLASINANLDRISALTGWRSQSGENNGSISLQDLPVIEQALAQFRPRLFVIDPIQAYIGSRVDVNRTNEVRPILANLGQLAERYRCAIICVRHITKKTGRGKALYRGQGSIDFTAAARSVLLIAPDPENPEIRVIAQVKSNLSAIGPSQTYKIQDGIFTWAGISDLTADDLLMPSVSGVARSAIGFATEFLEEILKGGSRLTTEIFEEAGQFEISVSSLRRAKKALGIIAERQGGLGEAGAWFWSFPDD